jgi:cytoskeleton protein RodZ
MKDESEQHTIAPFIGRVLKSARLERKLTLEAVAKSLCISKSSLTRLEEDHDNLVCDVYNLGFLRSYAQYLGLDVEDLVQKFKDQATVPNASHLVFPAPLPGRGMPNFRILGLTLLFLFMVIAGWEWYGYQETAPLLQEDPIFAEAQPEEELKEAPHSSTESMPLVQQSIPETSSLIETQAPPKEPLSPEGVLLKTTAASWIEVKDENGEMILNRLFHPGETYEFKNSQNLVLKTGNAAGVSLVSGEKILPSLGKSGEVKSKISLDPEKWLEQAPETH